MSKEKEMVQTLGANLMTIAAILDEFAETLFDGNRLRWCPPDSLRDGCWMWQPVDSSDSWQEWESPDVDPTPRPMELLEKLSKIFADMEVE